MCIFHFCFQSKVELLRIWHIYMSPLFNQEPVDMRALELFFHELLLLPNLKLLHFSRFKVNKLLLRFEDKSNFNFTKTIS